MKTIRPVLTEDEQKQVDEYFNFAAMNTEEKKPFLTEEDIEILEQLARLFFFSELTLDTKDRKDPMASFSVKQVLNRVKLMNSWIAELEKQLSKAGEFKTYVHDRLDKIGIEKDPESPHKEKGCRIGGRLDIVESEIKKLREERDVDMIKFARYLERLHFAGRPNLELSYEELLEQFKSQK